MVLLIIQAAYWFTLKPSSLIKYDDRPLKTNFDASTALYSDLLVSLYIVGTCSLPSYTTQSFHVGLIVENTSTIAPCNVIIIPSLHFFWRNSPDISTINASSSSWSLMILVMKMKSMYVIGYTICSFDL